MNRIIVALLAALEAVIAAAVGIGVALVPLTAMWATHYDLSVDWLVFWRAASDVWLLGNGVDIRVALDPDVATSLALPGAETPFAITIAPLGFALLAVFFGAHAGARAAATAHRLLASCVSIGLYWLIAIVATLSAGVADVSPSPWQGFLLPVLVYALGVAIGASRVGAPQVVRRAWQQVPAVARAIVRAALTGGTAAAAAVIGVASILVAVLVFANYATVIRVYEGIQAGVVGGVSLTVAQLAIVPNLVIWAASWLVGPGFAIGTGSAVSPLGTQLGPIPAVPVLGALPTGEPALGFIGLLVPVLAGFLAGMMVRNIVARAFSNLPEARWLIVAGAAVGVAGGAVLGILAWASAGAAGPGRLTDVGPNPALVFVIAALEIGVPAIIGMFVRRPAATNPSADPEAGDAARGYVSTATQRHPVDSDGQTRRR